MLRLVVAAFAVLGFASTSIAQSNASLSKAQIKAVEDGVKRKLRDPESARFGRYAAAKQSDGSIVVCGWVNSKNGYGGYAGFGPYYGVLFDKPLGYEAKTVANGELGITGVTRYCREDGVQLPENP